MSADLRLGQGCRRRGEWLLALPAMTLHRLHVMRSSRARGRNITPALFLLAVFAFGACAEEASKPCSDCVDQLCVPSCEGRECGDDGCGGSCGKCEMAEDCVDALCLPQGCDCRSGASLCLDGEHLMHCSDGCHFERFDCEKLCLDRDFAASDGCQQREEQAPACYCRHFAGWGTSCQPELSACPSGSTTCLNFGEDAACSKRCSEDADCENVAPGDERCVAIGSGSKLCAVFCKSHSDCLASTHCVELEGEWGVCLGSPD